MYFCMYVHVSMHVPFSSHSVNRTLLINLLLYYNLYLTISMQLAEWVRGSHTVQSLSSDTSTFGCGAYLHLSELTW